MNLKWEITRIEKRQRKLKAVLSLMGMIVVTSVFTIYTGSVEEVLWNIVIVSGLFLLYLVFSWFYPHPKHSYMLDDEGVLIQRKKKIKKFRWAEFEVFYNFSTNKYFEAEKSVLGETFYLKRKGTTLYKDFVVVYSEPENANAVYSTLLSHIKEMPRTITTDWGLVWYRFR